jgi:ABC-type Zn uptake system ZnuABC Zn-binding protein ZnuA
LTGTASDVDQDFRIDPHTWLDPHNALRWVENIVQVLGTLDPANASTYRSKGDDYRQDLDLLITYYDEQITAIPDSKRKLITNHDSLGYFAARYDFTVFGTVIPGTSTVAEPSAADLTSLVELMQAHDICTVFTESTASDRLANAVTKELHDCGQVRVISLYSGALGPAGSGAETYLDMMRYNIDAIRAGSDS